MYVALYPFSSISHVDGPSPNVAPGNRLPVWYREQGKLQVQFMKWGLIPSFTKLDEELNSETLTQRPTFRRLLHRRRAIVFMNGFYEWHKIHKESQPYYVKTEQAMAMAALYDTWKKDQESLLYTVTIITRDPIPSFAWLHDRMPVRLRDRNMR